MLLLVVDISIIITSTILFIENIQDAIIFTIQVKHSVATGTDNSVAVASGAGALYTTTSGLFKWSRAVNNHTLLPDSLHKQAFTTVQGNYGLSWITRYAGSIPGFKSYCISFPEDGITIIYLSNYEDLDRHQLEKDLVALVFNQPYQLSK